MSSNKQFRNQREPVDEHPLSPDSLCIEDEEFSDKNDNQMVRPLSAQHRPLSRPTAATGAIPKETHSNQGSTRRQFHSRPFPLPVESATESQTMLPDDGESSQKVRPSKKEDIPECGPDFEQLLRKFKPRLDLINQLPVDHNSNKSSLKNKPKDENSESSEDYSKKQVRKIAIKLAHEASDIPCGNNKEPIRQHFDFNGQPGHTTLLPKIPLLPNPNQSDQDDRSLYQSFALDFPDFSQMNITMNPDFVDDGADFVDVHVGQKSSAENRRLSTIIAETRNRSSSMPPLSMPARVMVHGNIAVGGPAYLGVQREHAFEANEPMPRPQGKTPSTESDSQTSHDNSEIFFLSSDSGCNFLESELSTTNRLSRQSSSSSVLLPVDTVPLRLETPTGIDELTNEEENCQIDKLTQSLQKMATLQDGEIELYYGICAKCGTEIVGEGSAVKAMDKVYHKCCFLCVECLQELDNKPFYNVKGKVFCEKDYLERGLLETAEICNACHRPIMDIIIKAMTQNFHSKCFRCSVCSTNLEGKEFTIDKTQIYCVGDYFARYAPKCTICHKSIYPMDNNISLDKVCVVSQNLDYHIECYKCYFCGLGLADEQTIKCFPLNERLYCFNCNKLHQASMYKIDESKVDEPQGVKCCFLAY